eukprot:g34285.t1
MVHDQKVMSFVDFRAHLLYKVLSESTLGLTDVDEATSGSVDAVDQVEGCAGEPLSNVEGLFCALNEGEEGDVGAGVALPDVAVRGAGRPLPPPKSSTPPRDLPHNVPSAINHVVTPASPADAIDLVTSNAVSHAAAATSGTADAESTANAIPTADIKNDDVTSSDGNTTAAAVATPTTYIADVNNVTISTPTPSSNSTAGSTPSPSPKICRIFTIPPDLPLTEDQ